MKVYTKTGDKGLTSLIGGERVLKNHERIEAYGTVDELNSYLGLIACLDLSENDKKIIVEIQDRLFTIGSNLASDGNTVPSYIPLINLNDILLLESEIDRMTVVLPVLKTFILPGASIISAHCHIARCICRRAERCVVSLSENSFVDEKNVIYLNRLSDYLFTLAKKVNYDMSIDETPWIPRL